MERPKTPGHEPRRLHLAAAARAGNLAARSALVGPECPETLAYLLGWAQQLFGRSGIGMDGVAPLSYATIEAWARLRRIDVTPEEVDVLLQLDAAMRHPGDPSEENE